jgi:SOS-response transcriptional repressor LexA
MTERQKLVYDFIQTFIKVRGFSPSYAEIAQGLGMRSKSNIHRHIHALKERGLLQIKPHMIRSMKVVDSTVKQLVKL